MIVQLKSTTSGGPSVGAAVGGALGAIIVVCIVAGLAIRWNAGRTSSSPVQERKDHSSTESETGRIADHDDQYQTGIATQLFTPSTQGELVSAGNAVATPNSSSQPTLTGLKRRPSRPLRFKDQARSVSIEDVPLVSGYAVSGSSQQLVRRQDLPQQEPGSPVAQRLDTFFISDDAGSSRRSDRDGHHL
jgi:hypothetical protein